MGWTIYQAEHYKNGKIDRRAEVLELYNNKNYNLVKLVSKGSKYYALFENKSTKKMWACLYLTRTENNDTFCYKDIQLNPFEVGGIPNSILNSFVASSDEDKEWLQKNIQVNNEENKLSKKINMNDIVKCTTDRPILFRSSYFSNHYSIQPNEVFFVYLHKYYGKTVYQLLEQNNYGLIGTKQKFSLSFYKLTSKWFKSGAINAEVIENFQEV